MLFGTGCAATHRNQPDAPLLEGLDYHYPVTTGSYAPRPPVPRRTTTRPTTSLPDPDYEFDTLDRDTLEPEPDDDDDAPPPPVGLSPRLGELAQRFFNQGMVLTYAFHHEEAERSFREAAGLAPDCGMCWWGAALVAGPSSTGAMAAAAVPREQEALGSARALRDRVSPKERALIDALSKRYTDQAVEDRSELNEAYAAAMGEASARYPDDVEIGTLHVMSLMDLHPWDYWQPDGTPQPWAGQIVGLLESILARAPSHVGANQLRAIPYYASVRFGRWDAILAEPPPHAPTYPTIMWHFARGMAYAATADLDAAEEELVALRAFGEREDLEDVRVGAGDSVRSLLEIVRYLLAGEVAFHEARHDDAVEWLTKAVSAERQLTYGLPSDSFYPARHSLGHVLLKANRPAEAEIIYRADLEIHRENGWALNGLALALRAQGKNDEAKAVAERFRAAWPWADVELEGSRF